jgi:hypothetical protein
VGRHSAAPGTPAHPLVSAALAGRSDDPAGAHRELPDPGSPVGWPGTPDDGDRLPGEGPIGWPGELRGSGADAGRSPGGPLRDEELDDPAPAGRRAGWRRLFGRVRAA